MSRKAKKTRKSRQRFCGKWVLIEFCTSKRKNDHPAHSKPSPVKLGITITKRYGKAHDRNRMKRLIREAYRLCRPEIPLGFQFVVRPKMSYTQHPPLKTQDLISDFLQFIKLLSKFALVEKFGD